MTQKYSAGGEVVASSLEYVGTSSLPSFASLVETTRQPDLRVVMVQNAWNVVDLRTFVALLRPYPWTWRTRAVARRLVTQINLKRATKVVCLTESVADMLRRNTRASVVVVPVAMPAQLSIPDKVTSAPASGTALVVGALTWYKRPSLALHVLARHAPGVTSVTFVGTRDDSVWSEVSRVARSLDLEVSHLEVPHPQMPALYSEAEVTVLPSGLESLGFGLVEALAFGHRVMAADIPAHRDAARALGGREPEWFTSSAEVIATNNIFHPRVTNGEVESQWRRVAEQMVTC